ncbi:MAG: DMT family transporter [Lachnospiraceae bacterium]|nr:DMT family transporter [Lachnospiraceae bacterium]
MQKKTTRNSFLLFLTACIWGMAFVSQSKGMEFMGPFTFNGIRSIIGTLSLLVYLGVVCATGAKKLKEVDWKYTLRAGIWCGLLLTAASTFQQYGLVYTTVGKAGFITTLYIIFVPLAGIFFKRKVGAVIWFSALMAAVGMYLLCVTEDFRLGTGDILVFICAVIFAAHIMVVDHYSERSDGVIVSCIQFAVCGIVCTLAAFIFEKPTIGHILPGAGALLYAGVMSCGVAYTLQIVGQKDVNPTIAALILSLESVVATVAGWIAFKIGLLKADQTLTGKQIWGCVLVFAAVLLVQIPWGKIVLRKKDS